MQDPQDPQVSLEPLAMRVCPDQWDHQDLQEEEEQMDPQDPLVLEEKKVTL